MSFREAYFVDTAVSTTLTATVASQLLLAADGTQDWMFIQNTGSVDVYLSFGETATILKGMKLIPGASYENPGDIRLQMAVNAITATGTTTVICWTGV